MLTNNEGRSFGYFELHGEFYSLSLLRVSTDIFSMFCCNLDIWGLYGCLPSVAEFSERLFYTSSSFRNFNPLRFCFQYPALLNKVKCSEKQMSQICRRLGEMEFRATSGSISNEVPATRLYESPVLSNRISDSLITLVIITYSVTSSRADNYVKV